MRYVCKRYRNLSGVFRQLKDRIQLFKAANLIIDVQVFDSGEPFGIIQTQSMPIAFAPAMSEDKESPMSSSSFREAGAAAWSTGSKKAGCGLRLPISSERKIRLKQGVQPAVVQALNLCGNHAVADEKETVARL